MKYNIENNKINNKIFKFLILSIYMFIYGLLLSLIYIYFILPRNEGGIPIINPTIKPFLYNGMFIVKINDGYAIHIHHWILCLILICIIYYINIKKYKTISKYKNVIIGFLTGLTIQGLTYKDRFKILIENPYPHLS